MDIKNLGSFTYRHDLNSVYFNDTQRTSFLLRHGESAIRRTLDFVLSEINAPEWEDIHLEGFLSSSEAIRNLSEDLSVGFSFIVYPKKGQEIETYTLTKENFFTNAHRNPDPLTIFSIRSNICISPRRTDDTIWFPRDKELFNKISAGFLFKQNPLEHSEKYPGFEELLSHFDKYF